MRHSVIQEVYAQYATKVARVASAYFSPHRCVSTVAVMKSSTRVGTTANTSWNRMACCGWLRIRMEIEGTKRCEESEPGKELRIPLKGHIQYCQ